MLSIIIPTLNEAANISRIFDNISSSLHDNDYEIIISDGGSSDSTMKIAESFSGKTIISQPGRGSQLNNGALHSKGDVLLFIHADSILPESFDLLISKIMNDHNTDCWGFFLLQLSSRRRIFRIIEKMINLRSTVTSVSTGDQGLFISKSLFEKVSGYKQIPIMEDIDIAKRLKKIVSPMIIQTPIITSSRRWEQYGVIRTIVLMWALRFLFFIGISPVSLKSYYK